MILSDMLPDNLPIVNNAICQNLGFNYGELIPKEMENRNAFPPQKGLSSTFYQLIYIEEGEAILHSSSHKKRVRKSPFLYFCSPGRPHKLSVMRGAKGHVLSISKAILLDILNKLPDAAVSYRDEVFILDLGHYAGREVELAILQNAFENIRLEISKEESLGMRALLLCWIRLAYITAFRLAHRGATVLSCKHRHSTTFRDYLALIDEKFSEHWTLPQYAAYLNVTVSTLNNICREIGGNSAKEFVSERVMKEAEFLLRYTELNIIEIAHELGFKDSSYFSRFFRRYAKLNPRQYRQRYVEAALCEAIY